MSPLSAVVAAFAVSAATAVVASLTQRRRLFAVFQKPVTTALLFVVVGPPQSGFARLIDLGIAFSLAGDVAC